MIFYRDTHRAIAVPVVLWVYVLYLHVLYVHKSHLLVHASNLYGQGRTAAKHLLIILRNGDLRRCARRA